VPFFIIVPIWAVFVIAGLWLLFWRRWRFVSVYLLLVSTFGLLLSFLLSTGVLFLAGKVVGGTSLAWTALVAYLGGIVAGGILGMILGFLLSRWLVRQLGWRNRTEVGS
jgi:hypothetical protein